LKLYRRFLSLLKKMSRIRLIQKAQHVMCILILKHLTFAHIILHLMCCVWRID